MKDKIDKEIDRTIDILKEIPNMKTIPTEKTIQTMVNEVLQRYNARNVLNYDNKKGTKEC